MYLSRMEVAWDRVRNPYEIHRQIWKAFPGREKETRSEAAETRAGFLFRVEDRALGRPVHLLVQSRHEPEAAPGIAILAARRLDPQPSVGQRLGFVLTANPIKAIKDTERGSKAGKQTDKCRVPLIREDEQRMWLTRKLASVAQIESMTVLAHPPIFFRKGNRAGKIVSATFEGLIRVVDPALLRNVLENGIGPAKAFGCGLLLVRRIN